MRGLMHLLPTPAQWVPLSVTVQLMCNDGVVQSLEGVRYHTFTAEAGETVEDERAFFVVSKDCIFLDME